MTLSEYRAKKLHQRLEPIVGYYPPVELSPVLKVEQRKRWTERQRLEGEAADRAMIRLLKEESTWEWCDCE